MPICAIITCKNDSRKVSRDHGNVSFHRFPSDPYIKEKWIDATGQNNWFPTKHSKICSEHFTEGSFTETKKFRRLNIKAIPTINVPKMSTDNQSSTPSNVPAPSTSREPASQCCSSSGTQPSLQVGVEEPTDTTSSADETETLVVIKTEAEDEDEEMSLDTSNCQGTCSSMVQTSPKLEPAEFDFESPGPSDSPETLQLKHLLKEKSAVVEEQAVKIEMLLQEVNRLLARNQYLENVLKGSGIPYDD